MKLCRFLLEDPPPRVGLLLDDSKILDLTGQGVHRLSTLLESPDCVSRLQALASQQLQSHQGNQVRLLSPVEKQEVWAAGVTYLRSKKARINESSFSATAYDRVYDAARPELFFKSLPEKVAGPGEAVGIRSDSTWSVPEPELALVINSRGQIAGYTIGNDMSARDIEGENLLYLPQAKIYEHSCALGPCITVGVSEAEAREWRIKLEITRNTEAVFAGETSVGQIKRQFGELAGWLFRCQKIPHGAVLLTGTGIVPPDNFSLRAGDVVRINIDGVGSLTNPVVAV